MSPLLCPWPWWRDGRFSICFAKLFFGFFIPLGSLVASFLIICLYLLGFWRHKPRIQHSLGHSARNDEDELSGLAYAQQCIVTISTPLQILEAVSLVADIITETDLEGRGDTQAIFGSLLLSVYLVGLLGARRAFPQLRSTLRSHSEILYGVQCVLTIALLQTSYSNRTDIASLSLWLRLALFVVLITIHWSAPCLPSRRIDTSSLAKDETASLLSKLSFSWLNKVLWKAFRVGPLEGSDLHALNRRLLSSVVTSAFRKRATPSSSMLWCMFRFLKTDLLRQGAWAAINSAFVFVPAMLIKSILEYLESPSLQSSQSAWPYVFGLLAASLVNGVSTCQCDWVGNQIGCKVRAILLDRIYSKVLRRRLAGSSQASDEERNTDEQRTSDGAIYNFVSNDVQFISSMSGALYLVWITFPIQITIATCLIYGILGASGILGLLVMVALLPLNVVLSRHLAAVRGKLLLASDGRIQSSNEMLNAIRTIKYYAWEEPFRTRVITKRRAEMHIMRSQFLWWSVSMTVFHSLPFIVTIITLFFYTVVFKGQLVTSVAFPALAIFAVVRIPLDRMTDSIKYLIQAQVSFARVNQFLEEPETQNRAEVATRNQSFFGFSHAILTWPSSAFGPRVGGHEESPLLQADEDTTASSFALTNLDIRFQLKGLNVVCGPSGSGKSSVLLALMGEMQREAGIVSVPHDHSSARNSSTHDLQDHVPEELFNSTAYCPHEPWIMNQTIRANILLGLPFDGPRYEAVVHAVALDTDIATFRNGDEALAGENGSRLSGGQKQRVSLARAIYSPSRYVLLDDCLSALDARTARHVFFSAIKGPLMRGRTCVLATHHTKLAIPHCDYVVRLESGRVSAQGPARDLMTEAILDTGKMGEHTETSQGEESDGSAMEASTPPVATEAEEQGKTQQPDLGETKAEGAVTWPVIHNYLKAMGPAIFWVFVTLGFAAQQLVALGTNLWIRNWAFQYDQAEKAHSRPTTTTTTDEDSSPASLSAWYYLTIYAGICLAYALITFLRDLLTFSGSIRASTKIYEQLLHAVLFARFDFFDRPLGQITNRLSKDVSIMDDSLASFSVSAFQLAMTVATVAVLMLWLLPGSTLLIFAFLALLFAAYYLLTAVYIRGAQDLKRIEAIARSPLFQHVSEALAGYVSIRGYRRDAAFTAAHGRLVDGLNAPLLLLQAGEQWLALRVHLLSSAITFATGGLVVLFGRGGGGGGGGQGATPTSEDAGAAGLVLTYAATFAENMLWLVQVYAIIQQALTSVERIAEYTSTEQEQPGPAPTAAGRHRPREPPVSESWPTQGGVVFHNFTTRYAAHLPPVLHAITFRAHPGQRVAIVGRTGAGKSSLALALLRILAPDPDSDGSGGGRIEIDGVDIATVPLATLRGRALTVVPQDPQLFEGSSSSSSSSSTVDANLDPAQQLLHGTAAAVDSKVAVLRSMQPPPEDELEDALGARSARLDLAQPVSSLSRGQRQVLCVARGLLRNSRVLVLDEATANVDHAADAAIQAGLRAQALENGTTVITIAHRLLTIADYDRVVVLEAGRVVEQGSVRELLERGDGKTVFRRLCEESGDLGAICRIAGL